MYARAHDPWQYSTSAYERQRHAEMLSLVPREGIRRAIDIGCGEGHFTELLAPLVEELVATDVSSIALERAAQRCTASHAEHVQFHQLDLATTVIPGPADLIVCGELLYYCCADVDCLAKVARKLARALSENGYLLIAHSNIVGDQVGGEPALDWPVPFGVRTIGEVLAKTGRLRLVQEIVTPLYRLQLYRRQSVLRGLLPAARPFVQYTEHAQPMPAMQRQIVTGAAPPRPRAAAKPVVTERLPILRYARIFPEQLEEQLRFLRGGGYRSVTLEQWRSCAHRRRPEIGRACVLTFDEGFRDFYEFAWPLLKRYGFGAYVFITTDRIGKSNSDGAPLLSASDLAELSREGVRIGIHGASGRALRSLNNVDLAKDAARARAAILNAAGTSAAGCDVIAYGRDGIDRSAAHLIGACGYHFGLLRDGGLAQYDDPAMMLPRVTIADAETIQSFVLKLS
jgi:peptidoglycan/xylan/chitin deacetylase (PgdA/CDA1 family)